MSKHIPDTAQANAALATGREASRKDHLPYDVRHMDDVEWETCLLYTSDAADE